MCAPAAALAVVSTGLSIAGSVMQYQGQKSATDQYNQQAAINARDAQLAFANKTADINRNYIYDAKANQQEGYKNAMALRRGEGTIKASAGASGLDASSLSVDSILANERQIAAGNEAIINDRVDNLKSSRQSQVDTAMAEAQGRINSMPYKAGPNPLGLAINVAGDLVGGFREYKKATG